MANSGHSSAREVRVGMAGVRSGNALVVSAGALGTEVRRARKEMARSFEERLEWPFIDRSARASELVRSRTGGEQQRAGYSGSGGRK
jgi:hypothetical protein